MTEGSFRAAVEDCWDHSSHKDPYRPRDGVAYFETSRCGSVTSFEDDAIPEHPFACSLASSSMTELSSLYSMGEDDYDRLASQTVQNMLNDVDAMLYDPSNNSRCSNLNLAEECAIWTSTFPHMRIQGKQIGNHGDDGFQFYPTIPIRQISGRRRSSGASSADELPHDVTRLTLSGKHVAVVEGMSSVDDDCHPEEEIFAQDGVVEETIAVDRLSLLGNEDTLPIKRRLQRGVPPVTPVNCWRDCVVSVIFDDLKAHIGPFIVPLMHRLIKAKHSGVSRTKLDGVRSWKRDALRMMQPYGVKDLHHDDFELSPSSALSSPESTAQTALSDKMLHTFSNAGISPYGAMQLETSTLDGLLTVRSKALLVRDKSSLIGDSMLDDSSMNISPAIAINRPKTSVSALYSSGNMRSTSAQRHTSTVLRPGRLVPLLEENHQRGKQQQYHTTGPPLVLNAGSRSVTISNNFNVGPSHNVVSISPSSLDTHSSGQGPSQSTSGQGGFQSIGSAGLILGPSPTPFSVGQTASNGSTHIASVATTTTSGAVMRSLLPPISHKRDVTSANINRALPTHRTAVHSGGSSHSKEQRLLPARDREKFLVVDVFHRPSTTHTLYRSETSLSNNRRPTAGSVNSRQLVTAFDAKRNQHPVLNVTGSSLLHQTEHTPEPTVNPRSPEYELMDHGPVHTPPRRFRTQQNIAVT